MDDPQYNKLKQRIREVFDDFDESADAGWLQLREKFPERKHRRAALWIWSAAAVLLLFLGFALRMYVIGDKQADNKKISYRIKEIQQSKPALQPQKTVIASQQKANTRYNSSGNSAYTTVAGSLFRVKPATAKPSADRVASKKDTLIAKQAVPVNSPVAHLSQSGMAQQTNQIAALPSDSAKKTSAPHTSGLVADAQQKPTLHDTVSKTFAFITPHPNKTIVDMFAADKGRTGDDINLKKVKKVIFGIFAATYFNYAKGSSNQVNAGAGFTADIALTGNLKLVTGLSVNQNSFAYNSSSGIYTNFPASDVFGINSSGNITYTQNARLVGLDIPLDLKYVLTSRKNQVYILAGVGSGTFINESYGYVNSDGSTAASVQSGKGFNDFYFARTMNIALGLGYPLGNNQIVIEPFIKYPLQGLGAEQLRFSASGINLKFNFSIKK